MDNRLIYDVEKCMYTFNGRDLKVSENDTTYLFRDVRSDELVYYLDYSFILNLPRQTEQDEHILKIAILSDIGRVPTAMLMPIGFDSFVHNNAVRNLTSLKRLSAWIVFISQKVNGTYRQQSFTPFEAIQLAKVFEDLNVDTLSDSNRQCIRDSRSIFDFNENLSKMTWFNYQIIAKYGINVPVFDEKDNVFNVLEPSEAFVLANKIMRYVCVWEASNYQLDQVISSNIVFIHFLQDLNASTNSYTALLPIMQALAVYVEKRTVPPSESNELLNKAKTIFRRASFNRNDNRSGLYSFQMRLKNVDPVCNRQDCLEIIRHCFFEHNPFKEEEFDVVIQYLRLVLNKYAKSELYIYVLIYGLSLATLRIAKPVKSPTGIMDLTNFNIDSLEPRKISQEKLTTLKNEMRQDLLVLFEFIKPYYEFLKSLEKSDKNFKIYNITDETLFCFLKTNNKFSEFVDYMMKVVLPLVTSHLT